MSVLDWVIAALVLLLGVRGFHVGFVSGALSLAGLGFGAYLGSRLAYSMVRAETDLAAYAPLILLLGALIFAGIGRALAGAVGGRVGSSLRRVPAMGALDGVGGAALGATAALLFAWVLGTFVLQGPLPQPVQEPVERSEILGAVNERLPSDFLLETIARMDPLPRIEGPQPG